MSEEPKETKEPVQGEALEFVEGEIDLKSSPVLEEVETRPAPPEEIEEVPRIRYTRKIEIKPKPFSDYMVGKPVLDLERTDTQVQEGLLYRMRKSSPMALWHESQRRMEAVRREGREKLRRRQSILFMQMILYPFIDGVAKGAKNSPPEQLTLMIRQGQTIGHVIASAPPEEINTLLSDPQISMWMGLARPFLKAEEADIRGPNPVEGGLNAVDWWLERIKETRLDYYRIIIREKNGKWWLQESLVDCFHFIKGKLF